MRGTVFALWHRHSIRKRIQAGYVLRSSPARSISDFLGPHRLMWPSRTPQGRMYQAYRGSRSRRRKRALSLHAVSDAHEAFPRRPSCPLAPSLPHRRCHRSSRSNQPKMPAKSSSRVISHRQIQLHLQMRAPNLSRSHLRMCARHPPCQAAQCPAKNRLTPPTKLVNSQDI